MANLLDALAQALNFKYELYRPADGAWGAPQPDGDWNGMIGMVKRNEADLALGPFGLTYSRSQVVEFSQPILIDYYRILVKRGQPETDPWGFFQPLGYYVWTGTLASLFIVTLFTIIGVLVLERKVLGFSRAEKNKAMTCFRIFWDQFSVLIQQIWYDITYVMYGIAWCSMYSMLWYDMERHGMVRHGMVCYGMIWYDKIWFGMVCYGMACCGMVWLEVKSHYSSLKAKVLDDRSTSTETSLMRPYTLLTTRMLTALWLLAVLVIMRSYSGALTSLLAVKYVPIRIDTLQELIDDKPFKLIFEASTALTEYLGKAKAGIYGELARVDREEGRSSYLKTTKLFDAAFVDVREGEHALLVEETTCMKITSDDFSKIGKCDFYIAKEAYWPLIFCMIGRKELTFMGTINAKIQALVEHDLYGNWLSQELPNATACLSAPTKVTVTEAYNMTGLWGIFVVLGVGLSFAAGVFLLELLFPSRGKAFFGIGALEGSNQEGIHTTGFGEDGFVVKNLQKHLRLQSPRSVGMGQSSVQLIVLQATAPHRCTINAKIPHLAQKILCFSTFFIR
ncbi:uncharacterized protein LOC143027321 [Oratosquilla oratoria]|uniref:uncharacterized protein LOC143027321 n=1 Tax=Oratosquilla oratoria TaxID=337810 RepID=UPI003F75FE8A